VENGKMVLKAYDIHKSYYIGKSELPVLKGINLEAHEGEIIAVVGPSGVGKSTLLHVIGALDRPTKGKVEIDETDIFNFSDDNLAKFRNKNIGFVFQFHHLLPEFTALENVMIPGFIADEDKSLVKEKAEKILEEVGLKERMEHKPSELSGGEQQRVAVARALLNEPRLILADEPSGNLDRQNSEALHNLMWELSRKRNQTFIIVTHNEKLAGDANKIIELFDGRVK
jgi:lipoprotein-releasing system ATP-binding protein